MEPRFSPAALAVLEERYLLRDEQGQLVEDPIGMLRRVARALAAPAAKFGEKPEEWEERFFQRLASLQFLPNSPTLMNAGLPKGQLAACFVLPVEDDLDSIFTALLRMARIHQTGGGTGFSFSHLRARGDRVRSTGGVSSGPVSFMELFDHATAVIREGGRRRGANMAVLRVDHPDIDAFVRAKLSPGRLENFNLSVGITDAFFRAYDEGVPFPLVNPRNGQVVEQIDPRQLFSRIAEAAWQCGDPGLVFLDEINRHQPTPALGPIEATNPCGEQPLLPNESCVLGSLSLPRFVRGTSLDWEELRRAVHEAVVFLDNVIEVTAYPSLEIELATRRTRKVGLGIMGWADLLAILDIPYDSPAALELAGEVAVFINVEARIASVELARRRGPFPAFAESVWPARGFKTLRNAAVTCIAPTGTISLIAGVSSGIEPFFALAVCRRVLDGRRFVEIHPQVERLLTEMPNEAEAIRAHLEEHGSFGSLDLVPEAIRRRFRTAHEIAPEWHLKVQAQFQAYTDAAVSKTINLPAEATPQQVLDTYLLARELRVKGVTVYRYGSRPGQVLSLVDDAAQAECRECAV
jgi:ribonucleoside-diphosphate reductase alpha chain